MEKNRKIEDLFRDKLDSFEFKYNPGDWEALSNRLPAGSKPSAWKLWAAAGIVSVSVIVGIFLFSDEENEKSPVSKVKTFVETIVNRKSAEQIKQPEHNDKETKSESDLNDESTAESINVVETVSEETYVTPTAAVVKVESIEKVADEIVKDEKIEAKAERNQLAPSTKFSINRLKGCAPVRINFYPQEKSDSIIYLWEFGDGSSSNDKQPSHEYTEPGEYYVMLTTKYYRSEKIVSEYYSEPVVVLESPVAELVCTPDEFNYRFTCKSVNTYGWKWLINDQEAGIEESFTKQFTRNGNYSICLYATHLNGCVTRITTDCEVVIVHKYAMPEAFTPNGNGINDGFGPEGENLQDYRFDIRVYNRQGQMMFKSSDPMEKWDGKIMGSDKKAPQGVYSYEIISTDSYGNIDKRNGHVTLLDVLNE